MLGFFPDPYPDEILYSVFARYSDRVQCPDNKQLISTLFGTRNALAVVDFPAYLDTLLANLPSGHCYNVDELIDKHTLLPFYSPFHPQARIDVVRESMGGSDKASATETLGLMANSVPPPDVLRFCPLCVEEDRQQFGECYWHRIHQVPGVEVCPQHQVFVENSRTRIHNQQTRHAFISAKQSVHTTAPRFINLSKSSDLTLLKIANDASWLFNQRLLTPGLDSFRDRYVMLLMQRQLATYQGRVYVSRLLNDFQFCYSSELLRQLHCELDSRSQHNWLFRLVRSPKNSQHPLHHLLLIHFLGHTVESFFRLPTNYQPFGQGQWACLNPVCQQFRQRRIKTYKLSFSQDSSRPVGTFSCKCCGFVYSRVGPDQSPEDTYRYSRVESYGKVWELALKEFWEDPQISLRETARRLDVDPKTVKLHIERLELTQQDSGNAATTSSNSELAFNHTHSEKRTAWAALKEANPDAGGKALRSQAPALYAWLYRNDRDWLKANMPPRQKTVSPERVNWHERDRDFSKAAQLAANNLKIQSGKPVQITVAKIGRAIGQLPILQKHLDKLPLTAQVLSDVVETREEFAVRRIQYAAECFREEGIYAKRWQLVRRAGLRPELETVPQVEQALSKALEELHPF